MGDGGSRSRWTGEEKSSSFFVESVKKRSNLESGTPTRSTYCKCRNMNEMVTEARLWTSWTDKNPERRFYGCPYYKKEGCGFFQWHDEQLTNRAKDVINQLKWKNKRLRGALCQRNGKGGMFDDTAGLEFDTESASARFPLPFHLLS